MLSLFGAALPAVSRDTNSIGRYIVATLTATALLIETALTSKREVTAPKFGPIDQHFIRWITPCLIRITSIIPQRSTPAFTLTTVGPWRNFIRFFFSEHSLLTTQPNYYCPKCPKHHCLNHVYQSHHCLKNQWCYRVTIFDQCINKCLLLS